MVIEKKIAGPTDQLDAVRCVAPWAEAHFGLISRTKLGALGVSPDVIRRMLHEGWLLRTEHRGIYRVGHGAEVRGQAQALQLAACGPKAALHGWSSLGWQGLCDPPKRTVHVIDPTGHARTLPGCRRSAGVLLPSETVLHERLRCTVTVRALLDAAAHTPRATLRQALTNAIRRGHDLSALHTDCRGRRGARLLTSELELLFPELAHTLSELEARFLRLLRRHGVALPDVNVPDGVRLLDCRWLGTTLVVELDGRRWHEHRFEEDRRRDNEHTLGGLRTLRFTWQDLVGRPDEVAAQVRRALAA